MEEPIDPKVPPDALNQRCDWSDVEEVYNQLRDSDMDETYTPSQYASLQCIEAHYHDSSSFQNSLPEYSPSNKSNSQASSLSKDSGEIVYCSKPIDKKDEIRNQDVDNEFRDISTVELDPDAPTAEIQFNSSGNQNNLLEDSLSNNANLQTASLTNDTCEIVSCSKPVDKIDATDKNEAKRNQDVDNESLDDSEIERREIEKMLTEYRSYAAKKVYEANLCNLCKQFVSNRDNCKACWSKYRCIFCDITIKGQYCKIKEHIEKKHFKNIDFLSNEEKLEYLKMERLIVHWPYKKVLLKYEVLN